jgi:hypothetical protein
LCEPCEPAAEAVRIDVVDKRALAVDLHDRQPLAVARLERGVAGDVDLGELESELVLERADGPARPLAEVAVGSVVQRDARYGYRPRVIVASATRLTAMP